VTSGGAPAAAAPRALPRGVVPQIWLGSDRYSHDGLERFLAGPVRELGLPGVMLHAGPRGLAGFWHSLAPRVLAHGVLAFAGFGLDGKKDGDGTFLTWQEKAECMGAVAIQASCAGVAMDAESAYDSGVPVPWADAQSMGRRFRELAPRAYVVHQPWWKPTVHWRFPYEPFAVTADEVAPQVYVNDAHGLDRYGWFWPGYQTAWAKLEHDRLAALGLVDPRFPTIQGYGWADILPDLVHCLLTNPRAIMWGEPFPAPETIAAMRFVKFLRDRGFFTDGMDPAEAVRAFQRSFNASAPSEKQLVVDGRAGLKTFAAAGITP
jgi:hypothetical protein